VDLDYAKTVLDTIHTRARKSHSAELLPSLNQSSIYLSRIMLHYDDKEVVLETYQQSLVDFLTRKSSALNSAFFQDFLQRFPSSGWYLRDDLLDLSTKAVNAYRQCQALHLVEVLLNSLPTEDMQPDVAKFLQKLNELLVTVIESACDDKASLSAAQLKPLFKLAMTAIRQSQRRGIVNAWGTSAWIPLRTKLEASARFKSSVALLKMCDQITQAQTSGKRDAKESKSKRKIDTVNTEQTSPGPSAKRKKQTK